MRLRIGYITNGFRDHYLEDVFEILRDLGYEGVGITLDAGHLDPLRSGREEVLVVREALRRTGLEPVVETGGRYVLDPRRKHHPTLISKTGRERRRDFYLRALEIAEVLGAKVLSLWSGAKEAAVDDGSAWNWLVEGLRAVAGEAGRRKVFLGFEPEPGMFIQSLDDFRALRERFSDPALRLTLDLGHLHLTEEPPLEGCIREFAGILANVHVDDIRGGRHLHLPPGEGEIDFPPLLEALEEIRYGGLALVELPRESHAAPETARRAMGFLNRALGPGGPSR